MDDFLRAFIFVVLLLINGSSNDSFEVYVK